MQQIQLLTSLQLSQIDWNIALPVGEGAVGLLLLILINVAGALPATPGNVGVFQVATVIPLTVTYGSSITETTALAFSIGLQVIEGSIGLGVGSAFLLKEGLRFKQLKQESTKDAAETGE